MIRGALIAWDPVAQEEVWRYQHAGPWNGGALATAGDLVFQGSLIGEFAAYDAEDGERLWVFPAQSGIAAAPATYRAGDEQFVAIAVGWGSVFALAGGEMTASMGMKNISRILAFRIGGEAALPQPQAPAPVRVPEPPEQFADADNVAYVRSIFYKRCWVCHGNDAASGGIVTLSACGLPRWPTSSGSRSSLPIPLPPKMSASVFSISSNGRFSDTPTR